MNIKPKAENKTSTAYKKREPRAPKKITETYLHNSGLYYLQRFSASSEHFRSVMMRKVKKSCMHHEEQDYEACAAMVDRLVEKFRSVELLNDDAYTKGMVTSLRRQGKSKKAVFAKLQAKRVPGALISRTLEIHDLDNAETEGEAELKAAIIFARKKRFGPFMGSKDIPNEKALSSMARAGFNYETCRIVLDMSTEQAQDRLAR